MVYPAHSTAPLSYTLFFGIDFLFNQPSVFQIHNENCFSQQCFEFICCSADLLHPCRHINDCFLFYGTFQRLESLVHGENRNDCKADSGTSLYNDLHFRCLTCNYCVYNSIFCWSVFGRLPDLVLNWSNNQRRCYQCCPPK